MINSNSLISIWRDNLDVVLVVALCIACSFAGFRFGVSAGKAQVAQHDKVAVEKALESQRLANTIGNDYELSRNDRVYQLEGVIADLKKEMAKDDEILSSCRLSDELKRLHDKVRAGANQPAS